MKARLDEAVAAATRAGELIVELSRGGEYEVRQKQGTELVTTADLQSDQLIREHLGSRFPDHRFLSEEVAVDGEFDFAGPVWIIDPIDGTANYAHGHPYVSISIALAVDGEPRLGVVHAPFLQETYTAIRGEGAARNGRPIRVSQVTELRSALVGTGFPHDRSDLPVPMERVRRLVTACQDIRRAGSPALDIASVAAGRLDAHCESLAPWDIAAAGLIATEAGAMRGNLAPPSSTWPTALRGEEFLIATPGIFEALSQLLKRECRKAARLLLIDEQNRLLLFQHSDPDGGLLWATPGGGLEEGETFEQAARREAFEELGVEQASFEYLWEATREFPWGHRLICQHEAFFRVRGARVQFSDAVQQMHRTEGIEQVRWWSLGELEANRDPIYPKGLAAKVRGCL